MAKKLSPATIWANKYTLLLLASYALISLLLSLPYLVQPLIADPDAYGRVLQAWIPLQKGDFWQANLNGEWLPVHAYVLRMGLFMWPDFYRSPQWLTFIISLAGIPLFYRYCREILNWRDSLIAAFVFTVLPLRYIISTQPLTEGMLIPFLLPALTLIASKRSIRWPGWTLLSLTIAMGIRYEAWYLLPFIWIAIITRIHHPAQRAAAILASVVVPAAWIMATYTATHEWLFFISRRINLAGPSMQPLIFHPYQAIHAMLTTLFTIIPLPFFILIIVGTFSLIRNKIGERQIVAAALPWYYLAILYTLIFFGAMEWIAPRFFLLTVILFIPALIIGLKSLYQISRVAYLVILASFMLTLPSYAANQHTSLTSYALLGNAPQKKYHDAREVIDFVNANTSYRFRYILSGNGADFVTMISYFTQSDMFITAYTPYQTDNPTHVIMEKDPAENIKPPEHAIIDNEYFSIYPISGEGGI